MCVLAQGIVGGIDYGTVTDIHESMKSPEYFYDADLESPRAGKYKHVNCFNLSS